MHQPGQREPGKRLTGDVRFQLELSYCVPLGIPHSKFLSWSDEDQDKALQYVLRENSRCKRCGTFPEDWLEYDEDIGGMVAREPAPLEVESHKCYGCLELQEAEEEIPAKMNRVIHLSFRKPQWNNERDHQGSTQERRQ